MRAGAAVALVALAAVAIGACGSSSGSSAAGGATAKSLLTQTFSGARAITSGRLTIAVSVIPAGSSTASKPIELSLSGPFQSRGANKVPASDLTLSLNAPGLSGSLGILSTGTAGYLTFEGSSYRLPASAFPVLESSVAGLSGSGGSSHSAPLSGLGIEPQQWAVDPSLTGTETVGGVETFHIHSGVDVPVLLAQVNTLLGSASALGVTGAGGVPARITPKSATKIAAEVKNATLDVWTGTSDKTLRKLSLSLTLPVGSQTGASLGGVHSATVNLTVEYADLGQPQAISAPAKAQPFGAFQSQIQPLLGQILGGLSSAGRADSAS